MAAASFSDSSAHDGPTPQSSANPLLSEQTDSQNEPTGKESKLLKKRLFGFGRKKDADTEQETVAGDNMASEEQTYPTAATASSPPTAHSPPFNAAAPPHANREVSPGEARQGPGSPRALAHIYSGNAATSPTRQFRSSSPHLHSPPRLHSPASSQIFERDVQEPPPPELSPAIPSHVLTEDHIPPALEASSLAITEGLDPDEVEILMHAAHQPASVAVSSSLSESVLQSPTGLHSLDESFTSNTEYGSEEASNYGNIDTTDPRRLSFISFADVVHAEHTAGLPSDALNQLHLTSHSLASSTRNRSPSPVRSPTSSHGAGPSPPTSGAPSMKGLDLGKPKSPTLSSHGHISGDVIVETMSQALRSPASGDINTSLRSPPLSAFSIDERASETFLR